MEQLVNLAFDFTCDACNCRKPVVLQRREDFKLVFLRMIREHRDFHRKIKTTCGKMLATESKP
jgi:hypothetical protein